jgi:hypothetical protein
MRVDAQVDVLPRPAGIPLPVHRPPLVPVLALGLASSLFLAISFVLCVVSYLLFPSLPVAHDAISLVLPGFQFLTWPSFGLGLIESFAWGWYVSLIFGPLFNYFSMRLSHTRS